MFFSRLLESKDLEGGDVQEILVLFQVHGLKKDPIVSVQPSRVLMILPLDFTKINSKQTSFAGRER